MIRRAAAVTVGVVAWLAFGGFAAAAPAPAAPPSPAGATVTVDLTGALEPRVDQGVMVRTGETSTAPMLAVYVGLSIVGLTLALITARRHFLAVKATELATGIVAGRRARAEFWNVGAGADRAPSIAGNGRDRSRPQARAGLPMLVGSGETVSLGEHGPTARAGYAGGATYG